MKKILLFFLVISLSIVSFSQDQPSSLRIRMWDNSLFSTVFGGDESGRFQRTYNVRSLAGGEYYLKITQRISGNDEVVFESSIEIPAGMRVQAILQEDGSLEVSVMEDEQRTASAFDLKDKLQNIKTRGKTGTAADERNQLIEPLAFSEIFNDMQAAKTDQVRNVIGEDGLSKNLFTTAYIVQLLKLFKNETSRLEFSKSAYTRVVDPENYFQVKALFVKDENIYSLEKYMDEKANRTWQRKSERKF